MASRSRSPIEWIWEELKFAAGTVESAATIDAGRRARAPMVRRIGLSDLRAALAAGFADFTSCRSDVLFLCAFYPVAGLVLGRLAFGYNVLPLVFPLVAGFALVGPLVAVGLNEMSRRREAGRHVTWVDAFGVARSHAFGKIVMLGLLLVTIYLLWLVAAGLLYNVTLGPKPPASLGVFAHELLHTNAGLALILAGVGVGFLFALLVLAISVVSFPLLLDRDVRLETAITTSVRTIAENPMTMAAWGIVVAAGLVIGSIPLLLGLVVVLPVLGHATWHLYRRVVS